MSGSGGVSGSGVVLAFASDFSPSQIELVRTLELADTHGGDAKVFEAAVRAEYYDALAISDKNKRTRAYNVKLTMATYGIVDADARLTTFGRELFALRGDSDKLYAALARHILLNLRGIALVQCVQDMQAAGDTLDLVTLRAELERRGIQVPSGSSRISIMRLWLEKAGVFVGGRPGRAGGRRHRQFPPVHGDPASGRGPAAHGGHPVPALTGVSVGRGGAFRPQRGYEPGPPIQRLQRAVRQAQGVRWQGVPHRHWLAETGFIVGELCAGTDGARLADVPDSG